MGPKCRWGGGDRLCQTSPIPRSPDGDKNLICFWVLNILRRGLISLLTKSKRRAVFSWDRPLIYTSKRSVGYIIMYRDIFSPKACSRAICLFRSYQTPKAAIPNNKGNLFPLISLRIGVETNPMLSFLPRNWSILPTTIQTISIPKWKHVQQLLGLSSSKTTP